MRRPGRLLGKETVVVRRFGWEVIERVFVGRSYYSFRRISDGRRFEEGATKRIAYLYARSSIALKSGQKYSLLSGGKYSGIGDPYKWKYKNEEYKHRLSKNQMDAVNNKKGAAAKKPPKRRFSFLGVLPNPSVLAQGCMTSDGMLVGLKALEWRSRENVLVSPTMYTRWESITLRAKNYNTTDALRSQGGIHAAWPPTDGRVPGELLLYMGELREYTNPSVKRNDRKAIGAVLAQLGGWGKCATGDIGWRSEFAMIQKIWVVDSRILQDVKNRYPEVEVLHASEFSMKPEDFERVTLEG